MKENLTNKNIYLYFAETIYYVTPTISKAYKIFTILCFYAKALKTKLYMLSLIFNENFETFYEIYNYIKNKYNFYPKYITIDFNKIYFKAIMKLFPSTKIIPCYFHLMKNYYKKIKKIKR